MTQLTITLIAFGALLVTKTSGNFVHQNLSANPFNLTLDQPIELIRLALLELENLSVVERSAYDKKIYFSYHDNDHSGWYFKSVPVDEPAVMRNFTIAKNAILEAFTLACNGTNTSSFEVSPLISAKKNMYRSDYEIYFVVIQKGADKPWQCRACIQNLFLNSNPPIPFTKLIPLECHVPGGPKFTAFSSLNKIKISDPNDET